MRDHDPTQPLIFIHVPKTAGISVREIFSAWYGDRLHPHYFNPANQQMPPHVDLEAQTQAGTPPLIYGHFNRLRGFGVPDYYPQVRQFLAILRDPLDMHLSRYFFIRRKQATNHSIHSDLGDASAEAHVRDNHLNMLEHFPRPVTFDNYKDIIEEYFIDIGLFEDLPRTLTRFATKLGKDTALVDGLQHRNATPRSGSIPIDLQDQFREKWKLEYEVYSYVREMQSAL